MSSWRMPKTIGNKRHFLLCLALSWNQYFRLLTDFAWSHHSCSQKRTVYMYYVVMPSICQYQDLFLINIWLINHTLDLSYCTPQCTQSRLPLFKFYNSSYIISFLCYQPEQVWFYWKLIYSKNFISELLILKNSYLNVYSSHTKYTLTFEFHFPQFTINWHHDMTFLVWRHFIPYWTLFRIFVPLPLDLIELKNNFAWLIL